MKSIITKSVVILISIFFLNLNSQAEKVRILHTNDSHMNLLPGGPRDADLTAHQGGIAKFATVAGMTRYADSESLILHSGDFSIGDIMYCKFLGAAELQIMSQIGVNAIALGNHEFDLTPLYLDSVIYWGRLNQDMKILCANGNFSGYPPIQNKIISDTIFTCHNVKVGVFGMTTPETMLLSNPSPVTFSMDSADIVNKVIEEVTKLRMAGAKIVIMLSHMGYVNDVALAQIPKIDAIIGGHDHYLLKTPTIVQNMEGKNCYVVQVGAFYENAGKFEIEVTDGMVTNIAWSLIPLDENIPEAESVKQSLETLKTVVESTYGGIAPVYSTKIADVTETLSETSRDLTTDGFNDNQVGNLVADAFRAWGGTDLGMTASGMTSHQLFKGPIVGADIYRMMGYGFNTVNTLGFRMVKLEMTGADIMKGLQFGLLKIETTDDFLIQCSNLFYEYKYIKQEGHPLYHRGMLLSEKVLIGGQPIDTAKWYSITTQEGILAFLDILKEKIGINYKNPVIDPQLTEYMVLVGYLSQMKTIVPPKIDRLLDVEENQYTPLNSEFQKTYPNPCMNNVNLEFKIESAGGYLVEIYNQRGDLVQNLGNKNFDIGLNLLTISTSNLTSGIYTFIVSNSSQKIIGRFAVIK